MRSLPDADRVKFAAELVASVAPGEALSSATRQNAWLAEVDQRAASEPEESLGAEHELPAVRERLLSLQVNRPLVVGRIAEREVVGAARWYEARELGSGQAFVDEICACRSPRPNAPQLLG